MFGRGVEGGMERRGREKKKIMFGRFF